MNKYKEALDEFWETCPNPKEQYDDYQALKELVDKETPIKVKPYPEFKKYFHVARCPKCERIVEIDDIYCRECRQKLDWSDE